MKSPLGLLAAALFIVSSAGAEIKMPAGAFKVDKLEDAVKQAKEQKKPLAFLAAEEGSRAMNDTAEDSLKALADFAIVVYIKAESGSPGEIEQLAPPFATVFGNQLSLPKIVIGSPAEDEVWDTIVPRELSGGKARKAVRQSAAKVKAKSTPYFASKTPVPPVMPKDTMLAWGKSDGKGHWNGKFVRVEGDRVIMSAEDKEGSVPFEELCPAAVRYAKFIGEGGENPPDENKTDEVKPSGANKPAGENPETVKPAAPSAPALERWTNKDGKEIEATFVRLAAGKVTLRNAAGREYTIALDTLSPESQTQAKERAANSAKKP